jgi:agmatinase
VHVFYDEVLSKERLEGKLWAEQVKDVIETLPENLYISFDIDGLDPSLCPNTGTPVPGGLKFQEAIYLIDRIIRSGRKIIGFDLCEVGNDSWDANVGARILYRLGIYTGISNDLIGWE